MKDVRILFLGAAKRVSLLERFLASADRLNVNAELFSCEKDGGFYPAATCAKILPGPKFESNDFQQWLRTAIFERHIDIIIPNIDMATVALGLFASKFQEEFPNVFFAVSQFQLCEVMLNKKSAQEYFLSHGINTPLDTADVYPKFIKPLKGSASKGTAVVHSFQEAENFWGGRRKEDYFVSDYIEGIETTVDFYVSPKKGCVGYVFRDRLEVADGEVMVSKTREADRQEHELLDKVVGFSGWVGGGTLQYIRDRQKNIYVIEINPRLGGGVTCSIEAGLDVPLYILSEYLGCAFNPPEKIKRILMTRARRDFFYDFKNDFY